VTRKRFLLSLLILAFAGGGIFSYIRGVSREEVVTTATEIGSLYFEARFTWEAGDEPEAVSSKGWYEAPDLWRIETVSLGTDGRTYLSVQVSDGDTVLTYDAFKSTYYRESLATFRGSTWQAGHGRPDLPPAFGVGGFPGGDVDAWIESRRQSIWPPRLTDHHEILGYPVEVYLVGGHDSALYVSISRDLGMSLRYEARVPAGFVGAYIDEVTKLEVNPPIKDGLFDYEPPAGARRVDPPAIGNR
jgi:outer membrane lipoprotein-sorting protein